VTLASHELVKLLRLPNSTLYFVEGKLFFKGNKNLRIPVLENHELSQSKDFLEKPRPYNFQMGSRLSIEIKNRNIVKLGSCSSCSNFLILLSKSQFRNKRSRADVIISVHPPPPTTHQQLLKASGMIVFTLIQLTNQMRDIYMTFLHDFQMTFQMTFQITFLEEPYSHIICLMFHFYTPKLLTIGDPVKTPSLRA